MADFIETSLLNYGIKLTRDVRDIGLRQNIKEFMKSIRKADYVFLIISNEYLQSIACMYEILELIKDENYDKKIIPIVKDKANIFNVIGRGKYIEYWQNRYKEMEEEASKFDVLNRLSHIDELKKWNLFKEICQNFLKLFQI